MKVPSKEKVGLVLITATIITNPLTNQYIIDGITRFLVFISRNSGAYVTLVTAAYFIGFIFYSLWMSRERTNIPQKSAKTLKGGKLIET